MDRVRYFQAFGEINMFLLPRLVFNKSNIQTLLLSHTGRVDTAMQRVVAHADSMQGVFRAFDFADTRDIHKLNALKSVSTSWRDGVRVVLGDWKTHAGSWAVWDVIRTHHNIHGLHLPVACTIHPGRVYGSLSNGPADSSCSVAGHPSCSMHGVLRDMTLEYNEDVFNSPDDELDEHMRITRFVFECESVVYCSVRDAMKKAFPSNTAPTRRQAIESISMGAEVNGYWLDFAWREELLECEAVSGDTVMRRQNGTSIATALEP